MQPSIITIKEAGQLKKEDILNQYADLLKAWVIWVLQCIFK
jgi:hypothetical protein